MFDPGALIQAVDAAALRHPGAPALLSLGDASRSSGSISTVTFAQLSGIVHARATKLAAAGVRPRETVAVVADHSADSILDLLAVMAAGGVAVPLDPALPAGRLSAMFADSGASTILGSPPSCLTGVTEGIARAGPGSTIPPDGAGAGVLSPATILYTSGTTGRPKGVVLSHEGLLGHMRSFAARVGLTPVDRGLQFCSTSGDISLAETFIPLITGGSLVLRGPGPYLSPRELVDLVSATAVTWLDLPTAYWQQLAGAGGPLPSALRAIVIGGDRITARDVAGWVDAGYGHVRLLNAYGPTEGSITVMMHEIDPHVADDPPIGRPLDHIRAEALVADGSPAPAGVPGELVLTGPGVALGYHGRPDETAAAFEPCQPTLGHARYRTGDLVTVDRDGVFRFVGRTDHQLKIAGHRIEPREIEAIAETVEGVTSAVAVGRGEGADSRSIALFVTNATSPPDGLSHDLERSLVEDWQAIYDDNATAGPAAARAFNIQGWRSSTDNAPIPSDEMRQWVDETIELIDASPGDEVLEIGCGTGLLLHRLARTVLRYVGTDFSSKTLDVLRTTLDPSWDHITLHRAEATDLSSAAGVFDLVVINSVTQHFPSEQYLRAVLTAAVGRCRLGGRVVIGDVRSRPLLDAFHASVLAQRPEVTELGHAAAAAARVESARDEELVVAPQWFAELAKGDPLVSRVAATPKRGLARNEMTCFRFDVVLDVAGRVSWPVDRWVGWADVGSLAVLEVMARDVATGGAPIGIIGITNARMPCETADGGQVTLEPADVIAVAAASGVHAELSWLTSGADGSFDAVLSLDASPAEFQTIRSRWSGELINAPLRVLAAQQHERTVVGEVRRRLQAALPAAVVPSAIEVIAAMPTTPSGKMDRVALARRAEARSARRGNGAAPSGDLVGRLVEMVSDVLGRSDLEEHSEFFASGGTSLAAMRLVARIRDSCGVDLPLSAVFEAATMTELATVVGRASLADPPPRRRTDRARALPLSSTQQRLWIAQQLAGDDDVSLAIPSMSWLRTTVAPDRFAAACRYVVGRHEVLRARITFGPTGPEQRFDVAPDECDIGNWRARDRQAAEQMATDWAFRSFDLENGPLVRFLLVECVNEAESLIAVVVHHIAADATSLTIVVGELIAACLGEHPAARPASRDDDVVDFGDVVAWDSDRTATAEDAREAWRSALAMTAPRSLPARARLAAAGAAVRAQVVMLAIPDQVVAGVDLVAERLGTSRFGVLAGCHLLTVALATGTSCVAAAVPVSGRTAVELEGVVGPLVNLVVVAVEVDTAGPVAAVLCATHRSLVAALRRQHVPYDEICRVAPDTWPRTEHGVVEAMVQHLERDGPSQVAGIEVVPVADPGMVTRFPLEVLFEDDRVQSRIRLTFAPARLATEATRAYGSALLAILAELPRLLDRPWAELADTTARAGAAGGAILAVPTEPAMAREP